MKAIQFKLRHGGWATFFLSTNFTVHERREYKSNDNREIEMVTVLNDGNHNNGGWELEDDFAYVNQELGKLFNLEI